MNGPGNRTWRDTRDPTNPELALAFALTIGITALAGSFPYKVAQRKVREGAGN